MKSLFLAFGILAIASPFAAAQTSTWISDPAHSEVDFTVTHLTITNVRGRFGKVAARLQLDPADISKSTVIATIDVSTIDTGEAPRDNDLRSPRFFNVAQFPTATFASTTVTKMGNSLSVAGNLTLHGITKPVTLTVEGPTGPVQGMDHKPHSGFSATTTISRTAFGVGANTPGSIVGDKVKLSIDLDVAKQ
jgi:polyisoprenoid-binding protein YceI